jgi:hypothetical protein
MRPSGDDLAPTLPGGAFEIGVIGQGRRANQNFLFAPLPRWTHGWIVREAIASHRWGDHHVGSSRIPVRCVDLRAGCARPSDDRTRHCAGRQLPRSRVRPNRSLQRCVGIRPLPSSPRSVPAMLGAQPATTCSTATTPDAEGRSSRDARRLPPSSGWTRRARSRRGSRKPIRRIGPGSARATRSTRLTTNGKGPAHG